MSRIEDYKKRFIILYCIVGVLAFLTLSRLFMLQVVEGNKYKTITQGRLNKSVALKAPRGEILDRYGRPLVSNRVGYTIQITKTDIDNKELNRVIASLVNICNGGGVSYIDTLPLNFEKPFGFTYGNENEKEIAEKKKTLCKSLDIKEINTSEELLKELKDKYEIIGYDEETARKIAGVRSEMELRLFSKYNPYTFANDVNMNVVTKIKETTENLYGVNIITEYLRQYNEPGLASHILGRVGQIYKEEYEELKDKGYSMNDVLGKDGIEKYAESELKGKDGILSVEEDKNGHIVSSTATVTPVPGNDVVLTIDLELQKVAESMLKETIMKISSSGGEGYDADSGAVVVEDIHTGEILAMASYPTYNLETFNKDYSANYKNKSKPFWNRAIAGTYEPGSTFKMVTALAGLKDGVINKNTSIFCNGKYDYYAPSYTPSCWKKSGHGEMNVVKALENSCNIFFYDTGRKLGIDNLNRMTKELGLGDYTGIELPEEVKGVVAGPEYVESIGDKWWPGDTIQAAIGQSKNLFTPIQLANYIATIANGGTRYKTHLIKKIKEYSSSDLIKEYTPEVVNNVEIKAADHKLVMQGMRAVAEEGTASSVFKDFEVAIGGKTGTAEVSRGSNNGIFVAFAPYDNPQISISIVVEHGSHGNSIAPIAKEIIRKYFTGDYIEYTEQRNPMEIIK